MFDLLVIFGFLFIAYLTGSWMEKRHFQSIREREAAMVNHPFVIDQFRTQDLSQTEHVQFVDGSCVIAADRFKVFLGGVLSIFGGKIAAFESLTDRARREAVLRMREKAIGADMVVCTRIQFSELNSAQIEAIAYGTAIYSKDKSNTQDDEVSAYTF